MKPKPLVATTITVDKPLPILPDNRPPVVAPAVGVNRKSCSEKEWTESRIDLKDLHKHYLKLSKSRLTSININLFFLNMFSTIFFFFF